jgi:hypothetical protein
MQKKMNNRQSLAILVVIPVFIALLLIGCQKVINVNLVEAAPSLVIEGLITDSVGPYIVKISKSGSFFNQPILPPVSNATVVISDNTGIRDTLKEKLPGIYFTSKVQGIVGRTYSLVVISENISYSASSTMPRHVNIDALVLKKGQSQGIFGGHGQNETRVDIHCLFSDPIDKNFYRIKVYTNDSTSVENYKLYDDQYTNGEETDLEVRRVNVGDVSIVELISLDKFTYDYYLTLRDLLHANPIFGSTPVNPTTNLTNGALGYFGACAISSKAIIITDSLYNSVK